MRTTTPLAWPAAVAACVSLAVGAISLAAGLHHDRVAAQVASVELEVTGDQSTLV